MKHLFKSTPSSLFAALTFAGIVSSGYITLDAARPILAFLPSVSGLSILSALPTPSPQALVAGATTVSTQVERAMAPLRAQVSSLTSQIASIQAVQNDVVLGTSTVLGESDQQQETVAVREEFPPAVNLLRNSSFEEDSDGAPRQWQYQYDSTSGNTKTSAEAYRSGSKGLKVVGGGTGNYGVSQPAAKMIERRDYAFSIWVKPVNTDAHTLKLSFWDEVANKEAAAKTFSFSGTKEWSRIVFQISNKQGWNGKKWFPMITVNGLGAGALYLDDAQLEEASSYTPYHFTGGGATQSFVSVLGDGAVEVDAHGNIYPAVNGIGGLGTGDNKFSELKLSKATINKDGDLDIQGSLTINGNTTLKGTVGFTARFNTHLLPDQTNTYDLGSTTYLWRDLYVDGVGYIDAISSRSNANLQITVGTGTLNLSAATARLTGNLIVTGTETKNGVTYTYPGSDGSANTILTTDGAGVLTWTTAGGSGITADSLDFAQFDDSLDLDADTSINGALSFIIRTGNGARQNATSGSNDLQLASEDAMILDAGDFTLAASENAVAAVAINASRGGISLSSSSAGGNGNITLKAAGTLTLDTSINNTNVAVNTGTGDFLSNIGTGTVTAQDDVVAAIGLNASRGGIQLSTSDAAGNGLMYLKSAGSLVLDTSAKNTSIKLQAGTADIDVSSTLNLTAGGYINWWNTTGSGGIGIRDNNGTIEFKNTAGSWVGIASSASGGGWTDDGTTIRLDTGTDKISVGNPVGESGGFDVANDYSILLRAGFGARQNATSGANDFQAAAEDAMLLDAGDFTLAASEDAASAIAINASRGGISLSSSSAGGNGDITLKSAGTLTLDTSINNNNLVANTGTGRLVATSNNAGITALQFLTTNGGIDLSTSGLGGVGELRLRSGGSLKLDTSGNNNNLLIDTGTGDLLTNIGTGTLVAQDDTINAISLSASRGGINLSSSSASGNGDIKIRSAGTLHLDTSASPAGANILANTGIGRLIVTSGGTGTGSTAAISLLATNGGIDVSTSGAAGNGNLTLRSAGTLVLDTSASDTDINILAGNNTATSLTMRSDRGGIDLSSSSANGSGDIKIRAAGTLHLDTSGSTALGGANILANTGTGRLVVTSGGTGTGSTAAISLLATNGGIDVSTSGAAGNGNLTLRSAGNLTLDTTASDTNINVLAGNNTSTSLTLRSDRGGIDISSSAANGSGDITIRSGGTLRLDTSTNNSNIMLRAGTGRIDVSGNTILVNSGAGTLDLSANNTINIVSSTNASLWGETGTFLGRAGQVTTTYGRMCIRGSDGGTACPAGSDGRLFVQVTGEASADDPGDVFDVAEYYPASEPVESGSVVIADTSARATVKMSQYAYQKVLGVASSTPAVMIDEGWFGTGSSTMGPRDPMRPLVALVGRVPVKVTNENGSVKVGDRLVASSTPGYAMKATKQGMTLGMALEDQDFTDGTTAKVMTFVNVSWYFPEVIAELEHEYAVSQALGSVPDASGALAAAVESSETVTPGNTLAQMNTTTGLVLGTADASTGTAELAVAIPPTEFPNVSVTSALTVGKELVVRGTSRFEGEVTVLADASFQKSVIIVGNLRVGGNLDVAGAVTTPLVAGSAVAAGDPVSVNADGTVSRASGGRPVAGVAVTNAGTGESVKVAIAGRVGGLSGLSAGSRYFVSATGSLTTDGTEGQAIGVAVSSSELLVQPGVGLVAPSASEGLPGAAATEGSTSSTSTTTPPTVVESAAVVVPSPTPTPPTTLIETSTAPVVAESVVETATVTPTPEAPSPTPAP